MVFQGSYWKDGNYWLIEVPSLDIVTQGRTRREALAMIAEAIELHVDKKGFKAVVYEESVPVNRVWMLDIGTWEALVQELPGSASNFTWSSDSSRYAVALAPTPLVDDSYVARDVYVVNATNGEVLNNIGSVGKLGHFEFSPNGERIGYIGSVDINDPSAGRLYVVSSAGGERLELVPGYLGHIGDFTWQDDSHIRWLGQRGVWTEW